MVATVGSYISTDLSRFYCALTPKNLRQERCYRKQIMTTLSSGFESFFIFLSSRTFSQIAASGH